MNLYLLLRNWLLVAMNYRACLHLSIDKDDVSVVLLHKNTVRLVEAKSALPIVGDFAPIIQKTSWDNAAPLNEKVSFGQ